MTKEKELEVEMLNNIRKWIKRAEIIVHDKLKRRAKTRKAKQNNFESIVLAYENFSKGLFGKNKISTKPDGKLSEKLSDLLDNAESLVFKKFNDGSDAERKERFDDIERFYLAFLDELFPGSGNYCPPGTHLDGKSGNCVPN